MTWKVYTVDEANALLPRMEAVFSRIREELVHVRDRQEKLGVLDALWGERVLEAKNPDHEEFRAHRLRLRTAADRIDSLVRTGIVAQGIRFPTGGLEHGLLDFPTTWEGRWVFLCWRTGEERLGWWHEVDGGFAGRRPLTRAHVSRMGSWEPPSGSDEAAGRGG